MTRYFMKTAFTVFVAMMVSGALCWGAAPNLINYQGTLTNAAGDPLNYTNFAMKFRIYDAQTAGTLLWEETQPVAVIGGIYNVLLGAGTTTVGAFNSSLFSGTVRWLEVVAGTETLSPRQRITSVAYALQAGDSATLGGKTVTDFASSTHTQAFSTITGMVSDAQVPDNITVTQADTVDGKHASDFYLKTEVDALINSLKTRVTQLETLLAGVTRSGSDITFSGVNVHIVSGSGSTGGTKNGKGNLIVGYNETRGTGDDRSGSHNIIVGTKNNYSSYGGLVAGYENSVSGNYSSVSGGQNNTASNSYSSVSGGAGNEASGIYSSVSSGRANVASGSYSSINGGGSNVASGTYSSVSGGRSNSASGESSSVSGGRSNSASGSCSFVAGGGSDVISNGNTAFGDYAAILGGSINIAGDPNLTDHSIGLRSVISGGNKNTANGDYSSINGGIWNIASSLYSSVSGGASNISSDTYSSVSGGYKNKASGVCSSVSGGQSNEASGVNSSVSGGQSNEASGVNSSVSGGKYNIASGSYASVAGGGSDTSGYGNVAFGDYSAILGGYRNIAGDPTLTNHSTGRHSTVSGGTRNMASGKYSSVSGGDYNAASGEDSSVSGGFSNVSSDTDSSVSGGRYNKASGLSSSVSGGLGNEASGYHSSVSGGNARSVTGQYDWKAGTYFQDY